jgi:hypothetical protein
MDKRNHRPAKQQIKLVHTPVSLPVFRDYFHDHHVREIGDIEHVHVEDGFAAVGLQRLWHFKII